ncbi:hypothetical protein B0H10DRAFT_1981841 [Mycena sp. CBHHK59/15]|nr:hypothetical protein B0H10DRAFT_1981841 [Mycena sp. CBHHK59/15]
MSIPPPKNILQLQSRRTTSDELADALGWTWEQFARFKACIRTLAATRLNTLALQDDQDPKEWSQLVKDVLTTFPELVDFQQQWPVQVYFNNWVKHRQVNARKQLPKTRSGRNDDDKANEISNHDSENSEDDTPLSSISKNRPAKRSIAKDTMDRGIPAKRTRSSDTPLKQATKIYYIGQNPTMFKRPSDGGSSAPSARTRTSATPSPDDDHSLDRCNRRPHTPSSHVSRSPTQGSQIPLQSVKPTLIQNGLNAWPQWCVFCGVPPAVPECYTTEMRHCFKGDSYLCGTMGILHDRHFRILASQDKSRRDNFLLDFVPALFNQFKALDLAKRFDKFANDHSGEDVLPEGGQEIEVCSRHQANYVINVPSKLQASLESVGMEELGPAAVFLGIHSNTDFEMIRNFDAESKKEMVYSRLKEIKLNKFQLMILELVLA